MYEKEKIVKITMKRTMFVGNTQFQVPFCTTHYNGDLYYSVPGVSSNCDAIKLFEEVCRKENILLGKNIEYEYHPAENELYVSGDFLFFANSSEEIFEVCKKRMIYLDDVNEITSGFVTSRSESEIG